MQNITLPFSSSEPLSVFFSRGSGIESEHLVDIVLSDTNGKTIVSIGDLERIEVLKGPQGTLYGGSNIGGAVKFVSKRPTMGEDSGRIKVQAGGQVLMLAVTVLDWMIGYETRVVRCGS